MSKSRWGIIVILACLATTITFAESFFSSSTPKTNANPSILPPDDFKNKVNEMGTQSQNTLNQQVKTLLSKQNTPAVKPPAPAPVSTSTATEPAPAPAAQPATSAPEPTTQAEDTTPPPALETPTSNSANTSSSSSPSAPAALPQSQNQSYSGFVGGNDDKAGTKPAAGSNSQSSGGWNLKY